MAGAEPNQSLHNLAKEGKKLLSSECMSLIRTLPSEEGWTHWVILHLYRGFWHSSLFLNSILSVQKNFQSNNSDILLVSPPKSGTTWLKALVFALMNRSHYNPTNYNHHPLLHNNPHDLVPFLELNLFIKDPNPNLSSFAAPRLFATHIPFSSLPSSVKSSKCKIVYLCRNPKDTLTSLWHFLNKMNPISLEDVVDKFCRGINPYGPFWDHVLEYWKASQEDHNVLFLKFEEIKEQPQEQLKKLADFLGCPFSEEEETNGQVDEISRMCSFENLSRLQVNMSGKISSGGDSKNYFRQGKVGDFANYLTLEMIQRLDRITAEKFRGSTLNLL